MSVGQQHYGRGQGGVLVGTYALCKVWGRIIVHEYGLRSQYLRVERLFVDHPGRVRDRVRSHYPEVRVNALAERSKYPGGKMNGKQKIDLRVNAVPAAEVHNEAIRAYVPKKKKKGG